MPVENDYGLMPPLRLQGRELADDDEGRWSRYHRYLDFYGGSQFTGSARPGERRLTLNYARLLVNKGAAFLLGSGATYRCADAAAQAALERVAEDNAFELLDYETALDAAVLGDAGWKVTRDEQGFPRVRAVDMLGISASWAGDDVRRVLSVTERYSLEAVEVADRFGFRPGSETVEVIETWTPDSLRLAVEGADALYLPNPYGFIPYVLFPNLRRPRLFWGDSDLADLIELCSELNTRMSVMSQLLQLSGNPVLVLENVTESNGLRVGPGAIWHLPEDSKAYLLNLLEHGGLESHLSYISGLQQAIHDLAELPQAAFGRGEIAGQMASGTALQILLQPVEQRVARKRAIWTEALVRRARLCLRLLGLEASAPITVNWPGLPALSGNSVS